MHPNTVECLLDINRLFYTEFGEAFAATRRRLQPGVRRVLTGIPADGHWLDLGCGGGALGKVWARQFHAGSYTGLDASPVLLEHAQRTLPESLPTALTVRYAQADLAHPDWVQQAPIMPLDGILAFAVLHHLPSQDLRRRILQQIRSLLKPAGMFTHSEWQFQHSPRLLKRVQPWSLVGLQDADLEPGDALLDWRYQIQVAAAASGLRFVHLFNREELSSLADETGFAILNEFESDGENGRLALYQTWQAV